MKHKDIKPSDGSQKCSKFEVFAGALHQQKDERACFSAAPDRIEIMEHRIGQTDSIRSRGSIWLLTPVQRFAHFLKTIVGIKSTFDSVGRHVGGGHN